MNFIPLFVAILLIPAFAMAANWVEHPEDCPVEFESVSCTGGELQCGDANPGPYCYDMSTLNPPVSSGNSNSVNYDSGADGGWVLDCESTDGSEPFCDNGGSFSCDRAAACHNVGRQTTCSANTWANETTPYTCSASCRTDGNNHFACDGSTTDGDGCEIRVGDSCGNSTGTVDSSETCFDANNGECSRSSDYRDCDNDDSDGNELSCNGPNGCEINPGGACTVGALSGTLAASCPANCIVDVSNFQTGTLAEYSTALNTPMLWGYDYGLGPLINMTNDAYGSWLVNASGCINWMDGTSTCTDPVPGGSSDPHNATYTVLNWTNDFSITANGGDVIFKLGS